MSGVEKYGDENKENSWKDTNDTNELNNGGDYSLNSGGRLHNSSNGEWERRSPSRLPQRSKSNSRSNCYRCHSCRQGREGRIVKCSQCVFKFCQTCLLRQHGEDVIEALKPGIKWTCPRCRGGCGPGCEITCCNCSSCRHLQGLQPVGFMSYKVKSAGFTNVHDYLIHLTTGEPQEEIAKRKVSRGWTKVSGNWASGAKSSDNNIVQGKEGENITSSSSETETINMNSEDVRCESHQESQQEKKRKILGFGLDRTLDEKKRHHEEFNANYGSGPTQNEESDRGLNGVIRIDSLDVLREMDMNIYLMGLISNRKKTFVGNQMSITLSDKEFQQANAIKTRSSATVIPRGFDPRTFLNRPRHEQLNMRNRLMITFKNGFAELTNRLQEMDRVITGNFRKGKEDVLQEVEHSMKDVENEIGAIVHS